MCMYATQCFFSMCRISAVKAGERLGHGRTLLKMPFVMSVDNLEVSPRTKLAIFFHVFFWTRMAECFPWTYWRRMLRYAGPMAPLSDSPFPRGHMFTSQFFFLSLPGLPLLYPRLLRTAVATVGCFVTWDKSTRLIPWLLPLSVVGDLWDACFFFVQPWRRPVRGFRRVLRLSRLRFNPRLMSLRPLTRKRLI